MRNDVESTRPDAQPIPGLDAPTALLDPSDWPKAEPCAISASICEALRAVCAGEAESEALWLGRMEALTQMSCAMLCDLRDAGYAKMDLPTFFKALELDSIKRMREIEWIDEAWRAQAFGYMRSLPGFDQVLPAVEQDERATEAHDYLRFAVELPLRKALGLGFGDHPPILWERIPTTRLEKLAIEEKQELQECLERRPKKTRRRL